MLKKLFSQKTFGNKYFFAEKLFLAKNILGCKQFMTEKNCGKPDSKWLRYHYFKKIQYGRLTSKMAEIFGFKEGQL